MATPAWRELAESNQRPVNPFDFGPAFPNVFNTGGFDAVIGNPPYVLMQSLNQPRIFEFFASNYAAAKYKIDTYHLFLERALKLAKDGGFVGFIVPNTFLRNRHAFALRQLILSSAGIDRLLLFDYDVFDASVDTAVIVAQRRHKHRRRQVVTVERSAEVGKSALVGEFDQANWAQHPKQEFAVGVAKQVDPILKKVEVLSFPLGDIASAYFGIQTFDRKKYVSPTQRSARFKPVIDGANISRYRLNPPREFVDFRPEAIKSGGNQNVYEQDRICVRQIGAVPIGTVVHAGTYALNTIYNIYFIRPTAYSLRFVLGILSSRVAQCAWRAKFFDQKKTFPKIKKSDLLAIQIPRLDLDNSKVRRSHDLLDGTVSLMLKLNERAQHARAPNDQERLRREIAATDRRIEQVVYELYGLTQAEIRLVEEATAPSTSAERASPGAEVAQ